MGDLTMSKNYELLKQQIEESIELKKKVLDEVENILTIGGVVAKAFKDGNKVFAFGNGGSAADAQHIVAELAGRFNMDRPSLPAEALTTNTSTLTALANDYGYDEVFSHIVKGVCKKGDVLIALSTGGDSRNVIRGAEEGKRLGAIVVGFTGKKGGKLKALSDYVIHVRSSSTARIQETHILCGHLICDIVERTLFSQSKDEL